MLDRFIDLIPISHDQAIIQLYKAFHVHRCADVLLKVVSNADALDEVSAFLDAQNRVCLEAHATQRVNHPNVVRVIDASTGPTLNTFVALEYLEGQNLGEYLEKAAPLSVPHMLEIAIPLARAIDAAHAAGVIHGDIKPANVMLVEQGLKLVDFGCASSPMLMSLRPVGKATGTYAYMCPRYRATAELTERSDIFSFGVLLYEMLCGFNPFADDARSYVSETFTKPSSGRCRRSRYLPLSSKWRPPSPPSWLAKSTGRLRAIRTSASRPWPSFSRLWSCTKLRLDSIEPVERRSSSLVTSTLPLAVALPH